MYADSTTLSEHTPVRPAAHANWPQSTRRMTNNTIFGAQLANPQGCTKLFPGNGFGVEVDTATGQTGPFSVSISGNSIHDFNRNGIVAYGAGITAEVSSNTITGVGPSTGYFQFGI